MKEHLKSLQYLTRTITDKEIENQLIKFGLYEKKDVKLYKLSLGMKYKLILISTFLINKSYNFIEKLHTHYYDLNLLRGKFAPLKITNKK